MIMNQADICDYSDYDYHADFWKNQNREYEHQIEHITIQTLLRAHGSNKTSIMDAGCGFGRLFNSYQPLFNQYILVDYAQHLLDEAKESINSNNTVTFIKDSLYELTLDKKVDAIISIRTLHHLHKIENLFQKFHQNLNKNGILILDIPNYYHLKNRLKHPIQRKQKKVMQSKNFYNYDTNYVIKMLKKAGFEIIDRRSVGLFRLNIIKKHVSAERLVKLECMLNRLIKHFPITPSIYVLAKKCG